MQKKEAIKKIRIIFWAHAAATTAIVALIESGVIDCAASLLTPTTQYIAEVVGVMLTICGIPLALKGYSALMSRAAQKESSRLIEHYRQKSSVRTSIIFLLLIINSTLYQLLDNNSQLYCGLLCIAAAIYSYPTSASLEKYCNNTEETE